MHSVPTQYTRWPGRLLGKLASLAPLFLLLAAPAIGQGIAIDVTPGSQVPVGTKAVYKITARGLDGFKASVFLKATVPTLPSATITITPQTINHPYTDTATMTVTLTSVIGGTHTINVTGQNGDLMASATALITPRVYPNWKLYDSSNSPMKTHQINNLLLDRNGVGWIAESDQLLRFDGIEWTEFPDVKPYGDWRIAVDSNNGLWVADVEKVMRYNDGKWTVWTDTMLRDVIGSVYYLNTNMMAADRDGNVWIGSKHGFLLKFDGVNWTRYVSENGSLGSTHTMASDLAGNIWLAAYGGVLKFDGRFWTLYDKIAGEDFHSGSMLFVDRAGLLWLKGSDGYFLKMIDENNVVKYSESPWNHFPGYQVNVMAFDNRGHIWTGHNGSRYLDYGLGRARGWDGANWMTFNSLNSGLPENNVRHLICGDDGVIWIATATRGIALFDATSLPEEPVAGVVDDAAASGSALSVFPNPVGERADIRLALPAAGRVRLTVVDARGEEVARILDETVEAGERRVEYRFDALTPGAYFLHAVTPVGTMTRPIVVTGE